MSTLSVRIDYLQGLLKFDSDESFNSFLSFLNSGDDSWVTSSSSFWSGRSFSNRLSSAWGGSGGFNRSSCIDVILVLPGEYFSCCSVEWVSSLLSELRFLSFSCTRLDIALDDYLRRVPLDVVIDSAVSSACPGFESYRVIDGNGVSTVYFGSPTSDKQLRFYDADFLHGNGSHRWELQLRGDYASVSLFSIDVCNISSSLLSILKSVVVFKSGCSSIGTPNHPISFFWDSFFVDVPSVSFTLPSASSSLGSVLTWFSKQVIPSLCVLRFGLGKDAFLEYIDSQCYSALLSDRLSGKHYALIDFLSNNPGVI